MSLTGLQLRGRYCPALLRYAAALSPHCCRIPASQHASPSACVAMVNGFSIPATVELRDHISSATSMRLGQSFHAACKKPGLRRTCRGLHACNLRMPMQIPTASLDLDRGSLPPAQDHTCIEAVTAEMEYDPAPGCQALV